MEAKPDRLSFESPNGHNPPPDPDDSHASHFFRYSVFVVLEGAFTALAWYCYHRPRVLPGYVSYFEISTLKSGFITLFNVWHTIAIACASEICYEAFSREWDARKDGGERTDMVSKVTGGILDRIRYALIYDSTKTFRAAFVVFLGLVVMNNTGTSAVTVTSGTDVQEHVDIGLINTQNLSPTSTATGSSAFNVRLNEAGMIVKLERLYGAPWGYVPQPNWLIPLPAAQDLNMTQRVVYNSDLVRFQHDCKWQVVDQGWEGSQITVGNQTWSSLFFINSTMATASSESMLPSAESVWMPILHYAGNASSILQLTLQGQSTGSSAYLFLGGNATFPLNSTSPNEAWMDLSNLPTVSPPSDIFSYRLGTGVIVRAPVAALLVCDPKLTFTSGPVQLEPVSNLTQPDVTVIERQANPAERVGNIDQSAAQSLFTSMLATAINQQDPVSSTARLDFIGFNAIAGWMFLDLPPRQNRNWTAMGAIRPFDLVSIDQNVDKAMISALKAFTSGYDGDANISQVTGAFTKTVDAYSTSTLPTLSANRQFAILHSVLFGVLVISLATIVYLNKTQHRRPFSLKVLEAELRQG